jgi:hypothetical protein
MLVFTIVFSVVAYVLWNSFNFFFGPFFFIHWLGLGSTVFIAVFIPFYYILKRKRPQNRKILLRIHVFGNLFSFFLISIHFAQNIGRLANYYPKIEDGIVLFLVLTIIVVTGFLERFQPAKKWVKYTKFVHRYIIVIFYVIIFIHTLQGLNII